MSHVALYLLGPPRIERDGAPVEIDTRKAIALAAYLAVSGQSHSRDTLATLFWPLSNQARARSALRRTLSSLRKALGEAPLELDGEYLGLRPSADFRVDVDQFLCLMAKCEQHGHPLDKPCPRCLDPLSQAVDLYRNDFMSGFTLRDSPGFDQWQTFQTESLRLQLALALERLVRCHCDRWEFEPAIAYARRWMALDAWHGLPHYRLMQMYTWAGQRSAALRHYQEYVGILEQELGEAPDEEITQLYQAIRENQELPLPALTVPVPTDNLPLQPTPFVGREDELLEVGQLLDRASCRLLTLVGPGGIGKTRLALQAAALHIRAFPNGVFFVPLAQLSSADRLVPAIADALEFSFHGRVDPREQLLNYLREKVMLLLLDNFEHLISRDATELLVEMLSHIPGVKLLVTSRERLNLGWEWPFEVQGLRFPQEGWSASLEAYSATQLFLQTARRAHPGFALSEVEEPFVASICRSLQGMPLGIELAATWVEASSCQHIAHEIERNLDSLTTFRRDVPKRHRSLHAAFEHSWELLSTQERDILSRLSVFRSGFRHEAAAQVASASLMHLSALMNKSFLRRGLGGRYEMLEVLRQYAEHKLQASPQAWHEVHERHCAYYAEFLHQREEALTGAKPQAAFGAIREEIDNVRAAWRWAVVHGKREQIEQALESLCWFYKVRSWFYEGDDALRLAVQALEGEGEKDALLAKVLTRQATFWLRLSRFKEARELLRDTLSASQRLGLPQETALALNNLGSATAMLGNLDEAERLFQESITIYSALGDPTGKAKNLNNIGIVAMIQGRHADAKLLLQESFALREASGNLSGMVDSLSNLGLVAENLGEYDEAKRFHEKCFAFHKEMGARWGMANSLCNLAFSLCALGENRDARKCFQESLKIAVDLHAVDRIVEDLIGIATLLAQERDREPALELVACALDHPAVAGKAKERAEQLLSALESQLSPQTFAAAQERGQAQDLQRFARFYAGLERVAC